MCLMSSDKYTAEELESMSVWERPLGVGIRDAYWMVPDHDTLRNLRVLRPELTSGTLTNVPKRTVLVIPSRMSEEGAALFLRNNAILESRTEWFIHEVDMSRSDFVLYVKDIRTRNNQHPNPGHLDGASIYVNPSAAVSTKIKASELIQPNEKQEKMPTKKEAPTFKDAAIAGAKLGAVHASGEALLNLAEKMSADIPMFKPMLATMEGREAIKLILATAIRYSSNAFPAKQESIHMATDLQITSSFALLTGKYMGVLGETVANMTKSVAALSAETQTPDFEPLKAPSKQTANVSDAEIL